MTYNFTTLVLVFMMYSFMGWFMEVMVNLVNRKKVYVKFLYLSCMFIYTLAGSWISHSMVYFSFFTKYDEKL